MFDINKTKVTLLWAALLFCSFTPVLAQNAPEASSPPAKQKDIEFDPEKGIVLPPDPVEAPPETVSPEGEQLSPDTVRQLYPGSKQEDFLLEKAAQEPVAPPAFDPNRTYVDRQMEKQFGELRVYLLEMGEQYKKALIWVLDKLLIVLGFVKKWPIVESPPPPFLSVPLIGLIYFLVSYPLMKIARTVTNHEWMAWVPILQLALLLRMTERSQWTMLVFLIPVANIIFLVVIFKEICEMFRQPGWWGLLLLVPVVNIALLWYLAYVEFD